jgi:hypothetical protein
MEKKKRRRPELPSEIFRYVKRTRIEEERSELFDNAVKINDPRKNTPTHIVTSLWHCITGKTPARSPISPNTEKKYRKRVFDWWDKVQENREIHGGLVRARLLTHVAQSDLKKLGLLNILYISHCPTSAPTTEHGIIVTNGVSCEEVGNDDANIRQDDIKNHSGAEKVDNNDIGNVGNCDGNVDNNDHTVDGECNKPMFRLIFSLFDGHFRRRDEFCHTLLPSI